MRGFAVILMLTLLSVKSLFAEELPVVAEHSESRAVIYQGDQLKLTVKVANEVKEIQWWLSKIRFAKEKSVPSKGDYPLGFYRIIVVLINDAGSQFLNFQKVRKY